MDLWRPTDGTVLLNQLFYTSIYRNSFLSLFELLVIFIALVLLLHSHVHIKNAGKAGVFVFAFALLCFVFDLLNPNNDPSAGFLGIPWRYDLSVYVYLLLLFAVLFVDEVRVAEFLRSVGIAVLLFAFVRGVILLIQWARGEGSHTFYGVNATLTEGDTLRLFAALQIITMLVFVIKKNRLCALLSVLFFLIEVLSFRRQSLLTVIVAIVSILVWYVFIKNRARVFFKTVLYSLLLAAFGYVSVIGFGLEGEARIFIDRYFGMFAGERQGFSGDTGHFLESYLTMSEAFARGRFWGYGVADPDAIYIAGASSDFIVHNVYAAAWLYRGLYLTLFYVSLSGVVLYVLIRLVHRRRELRHEFLIFQGGVALFFLVTAVSWAFSPINGAESIRMRVLWTLLLAVVLRIGPLTFDLIFEKPVSATSREGTKSACRFPPNSRQKI